MAFSDCYTQFPFCYSSFLNNAARVANSKYTPTPDDILRARVQTIGVEEHRLVMENGTPVPRVASSSAYVELNRGYRTRMDIL
jgi:hypothetical protein